MNRVVITGIGAVSPNGIGREGFWRATASGVTGTNKITLFEDDDVPCRVTAEVKDMSFMDKLTFLTEKDKSRIQRAILYTRLKAVTLRGTADQIAIAERVVKERDK